MIGNGRSVSFSPRPMGVVARVRRKARIAKVAWIVFQVAACIGAGLTLAWLVR